MKKIKPPKRLRRPAGVRKHLRNLRKQEYRRAEEEWKEWKKR